MAGKKVDSLKGLKRCTLDDEGSGNYRLKGAPSSRLHRSLSRLAER